MARIAILGEAWGEEEERQRMPFVGGSGRLLNSMLEAAGIRRIDCFVTNVFNLRPRPTNDIKNLCGRKTDPEVALGLPPIAQGAYLKREYLPELERCSQELVEAQPNIIIALGNTAVWFLIGQTGISKIRGTIFQTKYGKALATYHPAAILRNFEDYPTAVFDLTKAARNAEFPEIRRPSRKIWLEPSIPTLEMFYDQQIKNASALAFDIETVGDQITCIGFAPNPSSILVVPFVDNRRPGGSYWATALEEVAAWAWVKKVLSLPIPKVGQNGMYDLHFLWRRMGIAVANYQHDTMLLHHALVPESKKSLDFLGSIYTDDAAWKMMKPRFNKTIKRDN